MARAALLVCPDNPEHGPLLEINGQDYLYCPHGAHDGPAKNGPEGQPIRTSPFFPLDRVLNPGVKVAVNATQATVFSSEVMPAVAGDLRTCVKCGDTYGPGEYSAHKGLPKHLRALGQSRN